MAAAFLSFLYGMEKSGMLIQGREAFGYPCHSVLQAKPGLFPFPQPNRPSIHYPSKLEQAGESYCSRGGPYV